MVLNYTVEVYILSTVNGIWYLPYKKPLAGSNRPNKPAGHFNSSDSSDSFYSVAGALKCIGLCSFVVPALTEWNKILKAIKTQDSVIECKQ